MWKQFLPGTIEPERGVRYTFQNYMGQKWSATFLSCRPDPDSHTGGLLISVSELPENVDGASMNERGEVAAQLPVWFQESA